jgi:SEC-C motif-containing protein
LTDLCVCGSAKTFASCCGRLLNAGEQAKTPEQLMRSRYSAYALGDYGEYLLRTWFPATAGDLTAAALSLRSCDWVKLEVLSKSQSGDSGEVEFKAWFNTEQGKLDVLHEKSVFTRVAGRWFYIGGEIERAEPVSSS